MVLSMEAIKIPNNNPATTNPNLFCLVTIEHLL
jgi:hypothetical protein